MLSLKYLSGQCLNMLALYRLEREELSFYKDISGVNAKLQNEIGVQQPNITLAIIQWLKHSHPSCIKATWANFMEVLSRLNLGNLVKDLKSYILEEGEYDGELE